MLCCYVLDVFLRTMGVPLVTRKEGNVSWYPVEFCKCSLLCWSLASSLFWAHLMHTSSLLPDRRINCVIVIWAVCALVTSFATSLAFWVSHTLAVLPSSIAVIVPMLIITKSWSTLLYTWEDLVEASSVLFRSRKLLRLLNACSFIHHFALTFSYMFD